MDIFRSVTDGTGRVFVIANASISYTNGGTSVADLKQKLIERDFSVRRLQGSFVMFSEDDEDTSEGYPITLSGGTVTGRIPMDRVAAKVQVFLDIPDHLTSANNETIWVPDLDNVRVFLANGMKRTRIRAAYSPAADGSDYFSFDYREVYDLTSRLDPNVAASYDADDAALYSGLSAAEKEYPYTSYPFYSYPCTWTDFHDHATAFIIDIPWSIADEDMNPTGTPESRYYQVSANTVSSTLERNHYYRTFVGIKSLGGVDEEQAVIITDCTYQVVPWIKADTEADGFPVVGDFETQSYLVVEPERVILNNEETTEFTYLSSTALSSAQTKVVKVTYYNYKNSTAPIIRTETSSPTVSGDANTNSSAISVDINEAGKVKVTHKLYNNDGSQKIFVEYEIVVRITNEDGLSEEVTIVQRPPLYVLMKDGDNAFIDGYFRHVQKTGGGAPFTNAYAYTDGFTGYYRSVADMQHSQSNGFDGYWYLGTRYSTNDAFTAEARNVYMVATPYGNLTGKPGDTTLNLYDLTGLHLSSFDANYHSYTVSIGTDGSGAVSQTFDYRIGDPRIINDFTDTPKLVNYLTGMGDDYTVPWNSNYRRYESDNVYTSEWGSLADKIKIGQTDHNENSYIAPYILFSSSWAGQVSNTSTGAGGVTYEEAKRRCATYQEGGYPAGRWRLPTEAEIMFTVERQVNNDINTLFNNSSSSIYWAASGYYYNNGALYESTNASRRGAARCVYDAWYWGDEPVEAAAYTYKPMP